MHSDLRGTRAGYEPKSGATRVDNAIGQVLCGGDWGWRSGVLVLIMAGCVYDRISTDT